MRWHEYTLHDTTPATARTHVHVKGRRAVEPVADLVEARHRVLAHHHLRQRHAPALPAAVRLCVRLWGWIGNGKPYPVSPCDVDRLGWANKEDRRLSLALSLVPDAAVRVVPDDRLGAVGEPQQGHHHLGPLLGHGATHLLMGSISRLVVGRSVVWTERRWTTPINIHSVNHQTPKPHTHTLP